MGMCLAVSIGIFFRNGSQKQQFPNTPNIESRMSATIFQRHMITMNLSKFGSAGGAGAFRFGISILYI